MCYSFLAPKVATKWAKNCWPTRPCLRTMNPVLQYVHHTPDTYVVVSPLISLTEQTRNKAWSVFCWLPHGWGVLVFSRPWIDETWTIKAYRCQQPANTSLTPCQRRFFKLVNIDRVAGVSPWSRWSNFYLQRFVFCHNFSAEHGWILFVDKSSFRARAVC